MPLIRRTPAPSPFLAGRTRPDLCGCVLKAVPSSATIATSRGVAEFEGGGSGRCRCSRTTKPGPTPLKWTPQPEDAASGCKAERRLPDETNPHRWATTWTRYAPMLSEGSWRAAGRRTSTHCAPLSGSSPDWRPPTCARIPSLVGRHRSGSEAAGSAFTESALEFDDRVGGFPSERRAAVG